MVAVAALISIALTQGPTTPLSGRVVGPTGEPVAGAELVLAGIPVYNPPIVARGRTDAEGRFTLERPADLAGQTRIIAPTLWVVKPGLRLSATRFPGPMPGAGEPVRVVLEPAGKAEIRVERPDGQPLPGARVRVERFGPDSMTVPTPVAELIEATTDNDGLAVVDAATNAQIAYVDVHSDEFGIQGRPFFPASPKPKRVWLRPASSLEGRIVADHPSMVKGWRVRAYTRFGSPSSQDPATNGYATGTTDEEGRFRFPVIASGGLQLVLVPPADQPVLPDIPTALAVVEGRLNSVEIPLRKPITITGLVRERGTGRPVPGVEMSLSPLGGGKSLTGKTDEEGRFTFPILPAPKFRVSLFHTPPTHVALPGPHWEDFEVAEGTERIELKPREVMLAAPPLRFVVRDEAGQPVAQARIFGRATTRTFGQTADDRGEFTVTGVAPGAEVAIEAHRHERTTDGPVKTVAGGENRVVVITIAPGRTVAAEGRVLGPGGTPIAGSPVSLQFREEANGRMGFPSMLQFDDGVSVVTEPDGTFRTPKALERRGREYRVSVRADGFLPGESDFVPAGEGERITIPNLVLRRVPTFRVVSGRVVDREGMGVAGASVFHAGDTPRTTTATTDAEGRFRLAGVSNRDTFVFADKAGFRFGGAIAGPDVETIDVRLARAQEPPRSTPKSQPSPLTRAEERAMARELLNPLIELARADSLGYAGNSVFPTLARVDPERVLGMLENRVLAGSAPALEQVVLAQLEDDPDAAIATIEADLNPTTRAMGFLAVADATPDSARDRRLGLIDRAAAEARRIDDPESKLRILGQVADRWLELDDLERARPILREGGTLAEAMPRDRYVPGLEEFAEVLAVIDLPAARAIFERKGRTNVSPTDPAMIHRHLGEAAVRLASIDPAAAERLVPAVVPNFWADTRAEVVLRIARRMARADLPRARKVLATIEARSESTSNSLPSLQRYGLGLMAGELAATDPATARGLLDEAFAGFRAKVRTRGPLEGGTPDSCVMAELLPLVAQLDPDHLEERLWLAVASRAALTEPMDMRAIQARVILALLVSRYDRAMSRVVIAPCLERLPELLATVTGGLIDRSTPIEALAAYDPKAVVTLLQTLPDSAKTNSSGKARVNGSFSSNETSPTLDVRLRLATAKMLGLPIEVRREKAIELSYYPWPLRRAR